MRNRRWICLLLAVLTLLACTACGVKTNDGASGDVRTKELRQVVTAVADGANCAQSASEFLEAKEAIEEAPSAV